MGVIALKEVDLIKELNNKDDKLAYKSLLTIEKLINESDIFYKHFDEFVQMLKNERSYVRIRGFRILCNLAKWDKKNKLNDIVDIMLLEFDNEKPILLRQCLEAINVLLLYKPDLSKIFKEKLKNIDVLKYKSSMRPLIQKDIDNILKNL